MSRWKTLLLSIAALVVLAALGAAPAGAAPPAQAAAPALVAATPAGCGLGNLAALTAASQGETCSVAQPASEVPDFMSPPADRRGYCHCGCVDVRTCRTSADCGGASCDQTISCC